MKHVSFKNKKVYYRDEGSGKIVMLLHGFAEDGTIWDSLLSELKENYRVIVPDLPGSGRSELLEGKVDIDAYAAAVQAISAAETIDHPGAFTMIGHSMGGYIALAFAEKYPDLLNGLGLFHSSAYADDDQKKEARTKGITFIQKNGGAAFLKNTIPNLFSENTKRTAPELVDQLIDVSKNFDARVLIQYYEAMMARPDRTAILTSFTGPVLFIQGAHDTAVPLQSGLQQAHLPAISFFHILKNSGHMGMWEEKETATLFINDFLLSIRT